MKKFFFNLIDLIYIISKFKRLVFSVIIYFPYFKTSLSSLLIIPLI